MSSNVGKQFKNPILPGFYPDPSVCRVGSDYYLINSTFEYFPGLPIHHSKDLLNWKLIGHVLEAHNALDLSSARAHGGLWAPTIRYHEGLFYVICTNVGDKGNFVMTAKDPAGPWSQPSWFSKEGFDTSLFFDDDGKAYMSMHQGTENGPVAQAEFDLKTLTCVGPWRELWKGMGGIWPEGPHMIRRNGYYYLLIAEGGTSYGHAVVLGRSRSPWGPFESCPQNPILSHASRPQQPIQATGHSDWVEAEDGSWWLVFLGIRPQEKERHHLGRETFLAPLRWDADGWLHVNEGAAIELSMPAADWMNPPAPETAWTDEFSTATLRPEWNFVRNPSMDDYQVDTQAHALRLKGSAVDLTQTASPSWVGIRQRHLQCSFSVNLEFVPEQSNEQAGLMLRMNEDFHVTLSVRHGDAGRELVLETRLAGKSSVLSRTALSEGAVTLRVDAQALDYAFSIEQTGKLHNVGTTKTADLATEVAGGFTGIYFGLYATGNGKPCHQVASFSKVVYTPLG